MKSISAGLSRIIVLSFLACLPAACTHNFNAPVAPSGGNPAAPTLTATSTPSSTASPTGTTVVPTSTPTSTVLTATATSTPTSTASPTPSGTVFSATPTGTPTTTPTATVTLTPTSTPNCNSYQVINLVGNLNTGLQLNQPGGILIIDLGNQWNLPFGTSESNGYDLNNKLNYLPDPNMPAVYFLQQANLTVPLDSSPIALPNHTTVIAGGQPSPLSININSPTALNFAWDQPSVFPAACTVVKSFTDTAGFNRQITFLFYQVNDLGVYGINTPPNNQAVYVWFAFDTSYSAPIEDWSLVGGTFILELSPFESPGNNVCDDRGMAGDVYWGDFLYFNSDGSLASEGAVRSSGGVKVQTKPHLLGKPGVGADNSTPYLGVNFGTAGMLGYGLRDGVTGDAAPFSVQ